MKTKQRDVYLSEYKTWSFKQRLYYILKNKMATNVKSFLPSCNPFLWCVWDLVKLIYLVVWLPIIWITLGVPLALYLAHDLKTKYVGYYDVDIKDNTLDTWTENNTHHTKMWVLEE